jgi:hypothetical protein
VQKQTNSALPNFEVIAFCSFLFPFRRRWGHIVICLGCQTKQIMLAKFQTLMCLFAKTVPDSGVQIPVKATYATAYSDSKNHLSNFNQTWQD